MSLGDESLGVNSLGEIAGAAPPSISAALTGTGVPTSTEATIINGGNTIIITLTGDTWVAAGATFDAQRQNIIDGLDSAQSELTGWNNEVRDKEVVGAVIRTSDTVVTVTLTASPLYDITATETITATIPATALVTSVAAVVATPTFTVTAITATAVITGTIVPTATEADIEAGGETLIITLTGDTWLAAGASFDAQRQNIINGITSSGSELTGWNNEVRDNESVTSVVRTSDNVVTVTFTAAPAYDVVSNETITVTIPDSALVSTSTPVIATPTFTVTAIAPPVVSGAITGTVVPNIPEANIVTGGDTIIITLTNDTWLAAGASFDAQRQNIINGLDSNQSEVSGWNAEVRDKELVTAVARTSDTVVTITLTASPLYNINIPETITVTIPSTALVTSSSDVIATPTFTVVAFIPTPTDNKNFQELKLEGANASGSLVFTRGVISVSGDFGGGDVSISMLGDESGATFDTFTAVAGNQARFFEAQRLFFSSNGGVATDITIRWFPVRKRY